MHTLSLATAVVEGGGDATAGCVSLVAEAMRRASPGLPCVFYLPRLEAWALHQVSPCTYHLISCLAWLLQCQDDLAR